MRRLVIIARDRPELWVSWASFYGDAATVEVLFDRRQEQPGTATGDRPDRRARSNRDAILRNRGFVLISQPNPAGASR
jgi:hypothetical protein